jgi:hypothetical protein
MTRPFVRLFSENLDLVYIGLFEEININEHRGELLLPDLLILGYRDVGFLMVCHYPHLILAQIYSIRPTRTPNQYEFDVHRIRKVDYVL